MIRNFIPSTITIGSVDLYTYGLLLGFSGVMMYLMSKKILRNGLNDWQYFLIALGALLGGRILFLLHNIDLVRLDLTYIFRISSGGFALYGAIVGGILAILLLRKVFKPNLAKVIDSLAIGLPLAQAIGRIGNFANNELYGKPTSVKWAVFIPKEDRILGYESFAGFHPTFLYESILDLVNFAILVVLYRSKKFKSGVLSAVYLLNYGVIRLILNRVRIDKEYFLGIETSDLFSVIAICLALYIIISSFLNSRRASL
ncbi:prolipoprotein diacylglyceryl transferase [Candidatus Dojkabacteria bacterium]|uniref:Phosphatidylglycerol--prolipoprotein diacylglyceryl transferase n=1 Tax=Candidatus Dojkabacteria bacterium TaxID=2099670 RepID=A0A955HXR3_9BACT|nr:prolipoprotein diacylglyceryl transferase [Candidatus Dojkabacteria bacterium]MCB9790564.1 prolipoprotein diacylglyceryl transferase [Candidatus Nomurabacteria bacterium]